MRLIGYSIVYCVDGDNVISWGNDNTPLHLWRGGMGEIRTMQYP